MSDGVVDLEFILRTQQAEAAVGGLDAKLEQMKKGASEAAKEAGKTATEVEKIDRSLKSFAASVMKVEATPLQKLNREAELLKRSLDADLVTLDAFNSRMSKINTERLSLASKSDADKRGVHDSMLGGMSASSAQPVVAAIDPMMSKLAAGMKDVEASSAKAMSMGNVLARAEQERIATQDRLQAELVQTAAAEKVLADARAKAAADQKKIDDAQIAAAKQVADAKAASDKRSVSAITSENTAPLDAYKQKIAELNRLKTEAGLAEDIHARAVVAAKKELQDAIGLTAKRKEAEREREKATKDAAAADKKASEELEQYTAAAKRMIATPVQRAMMTMAEETKKADSALKAGKLTVQEHSAVLAKLKENVDKVAEAEAKLGNETKEAHGDSVASMIGQHVAGIATISAAIGLAKQGWNEYYEARKRGLDAAKSIDTASRSLSQLADSPEELQAIYEKRDALAKKYGKTPESVTEALFAARSAGLSDVELETSLKGTLIGDNQKDAAEFMGAVKLNYGDKIAPRNAYNVALASSKDSPKLDQADVTKYLQPIMSSADVLGLSMEETAAIYSQTAHKFRSPEEAADRLKGLFSKMSTDNRYVGQGMAGLKSIVAETDEQAKEGEIVKDSSERLDALRRLRQGLPSAIEAAERYKQINAETGTGKDIVDRQIGVHLSDPTNRAVFAQRAEQSTRIAEKDAYAVDQSDAEIAYQQEGERLAKSDSWFGAKAAGHAARWLTGNFGSPTATRLATRTYENAAGANGLLPGSLGSLPLGGIPVVGPGIAAYRAYQSLPEDNAASSENSGGETLLKEMLTTLKNIEKTNERMASERQPPRPAPARPSRGGGF